MNVFDSPDFDQHETVAFFDDRASGLKAIIAIHSTALGPACGGTRMYPYASADAALTDALRLARGMSYKNAIADLPLGGGKAVIIGNPATDKSDAKFAAYAEAVNTLGGRYVTAMDVGILPADMPVIARGTQFIAGYDQPGVGPADQLRDDRHPVGAPVEAGLRAQHVGKKPQRRVQRIFDFDRRRVEHDGFAVDLRDPAPERQRHRLRSHLRRHAPARKLEGQAQRFERATNRDQQ